MAEGVGVFISYNHKDLGVANALVSALTAISDQLEVFIDHSGLEGGDEYEPKLAHAIKNSQWFLMLYSGMSQPNKNMNWCFFEAGQFRAKLEKEPIPLRPRDRMCYLYDGERPSQLSKLQGTFVSEQDRSGQKLKLEMEGDDFLEYENTELFDLFELIVTTSSRGPLRNLADDNVRKLLRRGVRDITRAFIKGGGYEKLYEVAFQPRISFALPPPRASDGNALKLETEVFGDDNTISALFGIAGRETTWGDIRQNCCPTSNEFEGLWISDIEAAIVDLSRGRVPSQTETLCIGNDGNFYRPLIARYEQYRNGTKNCFLVFIPARDRKFNVNLNTSLLLAALILSVRFRQRVIPLIVDMKKISALSVRSDVSSKKLELLQKFQKELTAIEVEAEEFGLKPPKDEHDEPPLLNAFRAGDAKDQMRVQIFDWMQSRKTIFDDIAAVRSKQASPSDAIDAIVNILENLDGVNSNFIRNITKEILYLESIEK